MKKKESKIPLLTGLVKNVRLYLRLFTDASTPWYVKALGPAALIYALFPADIIPDWLLGVGIVDDLAVVGLLVGLALKLLGKNTSDFDLSKEDDKS